MVTLTVICILLLAVLLIGVPILLGGMAIALDVLIGISPFLLIYFVYRWIKRRGDEPKDIY